MWQHVGPKYLLLTQPSCHHVGDGIAVLESFRHPEGLGSHFGWQNRTLSDQGHVWRVCLKSRNKFAVYPVPDHVYMSLWLSLHYLSVIFPLDGYTSEEQTWVLWVTKFICAALWTFSRKLSKLCAYDLSEIIHRSQQVDSLAGPKARSAMPSVRSPRCASFSRRAPSL